LQIMLSVGGHGGKMIPVVKHNSFGI
jgi:hypothetical protein